MLFSDLVKQTRTIRNFDPNYAVSKETLVKLIELCRYTPSTANLQPIKFAYACTKEMCDKIYPCLKWAGYLTDKPPYDGQTPTGYILLCADTGIMENPFDEGICAQTIVLGAREMGLGACMLGSIDKEALSDIFSLPENIKPLLIIALGKPKETAEIIDCTDGNIKYFRRGKEKNMVPKRTLDEIIVCGG